MSDIAKLWDEKQFDGAIVSFSKNLRVRNGVFEQIKTQGIPFANVIDSSAQINGNVVMGEGNVILAHCKIGVCAEMGDNKKKSAYVNIEHHNKLGKGCSFGPGVMTSGEVQIGSGIKFGTGVFVEPLLKIGDHAVISSGSILTGNVPEKVIVKNHVALKLTNAGH